MGARTDITNNLGRTPLMLYFIEPLDYVLSSSSEVLKNKEDNDTMEFEFYPQW
jgi:hypothetical protein